MSHVPEGEKTAYLVNAVLFYDQAAGLEEMVRRAVREELQGRQIPVNPAEKEENSGDVPEEMFEFLSMLQGE
uniref:plasmid segregation centromere-binding protein ParR n=1 Tax=Enterocloster clostridioformis TaxID=1531 RepID=UPI0025A60873|nr:plasmid segregation centromere-binding protein ParR [Enterocloster clostridioformis]